MQGATLLDAEVPSAKTWSTMTVYLTSRFKRRFGNPPAADLVQDACELTFSHVKPWDPAHLLAKKQQWNRLQAAARERFADKPDVLSVLELLFREVESVPEQMRSTGLSREKVYEAHRQIREFGRLWRDPGGAERAWQKSELSQ